MLAQDSQLGVKLARDIVISGIGQADDTALMSNSLHCIQNLLRLSLTYCAKANVELCADKTVLQAIAPRSLATEVEYLKEFSPVEMNKTKLAFHENAEHVGIIRSVSGNLPNIMSRISLHTKAIAAVLHVGAARGHRANPVAGLKLHRLFGAPVLMSGLGALVLNKLEISLVNSHHHKVIQNLLRLKPRTPHGVCLFLAALPGEALLHLRQLSILGMIIESEGSILHKHGLNALSSKPSSHSWFNQLKDLCLEYQLQHPLTCM